jgi:predicted transposase/invertase (TIGR01784 family)
MESVLSDIRVKVLFSDVRNADLLADFLSCAVCLPVGVFEKMEISDPFAREYEPAKKLHILDFKVTVASGEVVHVEFQRRNTGEIPRRLMAYGARQLSLQQSAGEGYASIRKVYTVAVVGESVTEGGGFRQVHSMLRRGDGVVLADCWDVVVLDLARLSVESDGTGLWYWLAFFAAKTEAEMAAIAEKSPVIARARAFLVSLPRDELERMREESYRWAEYDQRMLMRKVENESLQKGERKGMEKGKAEGLREGMEKGKAEGLQEGIEKGKAEGKAEGLQEGERKAVGYMARNMISRGFSLDTIALATGLSVEEIERLSGGMKSE